MKKDQSTCRMILRLVFLWLLTISVAVVILSCNASKTSSYEVSRFQGQAFGTSYAIVIAPDKTIQEQSRQYQKLAQAIKAELQAVNSSMSNWLADSEISTFNKAPIGQWQTLSPQLIRVLVDAKRIYIASQQAFDPSLDPLIKLWGFQGEVRNTPPPPYEITQALNTTGFESLEINTSTNQARRIKDIRINLSAIAKGHAVDRIAELLMRYEFENYLVEIGGEVRSSGKKFDHNWVIGIEKPDSQKRLVQQRLVLDDNVAVATSGSYRNYFESGGKTYQHILDPRTGYPVDNTVVSVSVIADDCTSADAFATAFMVLGEHSLAVAIEQEIDAMVIMQSTTGEQRTLLTPGFAERLRD